MSKGEIFTYVLTALGTVGSLVNPFVGLLVYVCFAILRPEYLWQWSLGQGHSFSRLVGVALLLGWAVHGFGRWRFGRAAVPVFVLVGYWLWSALSALQAVDQARAWALVEFFAKIILPFLAGATLIDSPRRVKQLAWVVLLSQGYVAFELNLTYFTTGLNTVYEDGFGGMDNNCVAIAMVTGVGLAFFLALGADRLWKKGVALLAAGLMAHAIMLSFSRGGILAFALTGLMAFVLIPKQPRHYLLLLLAIAIAFRLAGPKVRERFLTTFQESDSGVREASAESRLVLWRDCLDVMAKRPLLGAGPDNWGVIAPEYGWKRGKEAHSLWMQNAAEVGVPGVLLLLGFFALCILRLWPVARGKLEVDDPWLRDAARMVIASLFGFVIAAQFVTIKYLEIPFYVALIGVGVLQLARPAPAPQPAPFYPPASGVRRRVTVPSTS